MATPQPGPPALPRIQLSMMPQLAEARSQDDDWTGTSDAAARRRAQTRLSNRAYRKRKALAKKAQASTTLTEELVKPELIVECWDMKHEVVFKIPESRIKCLYDAKQPMMPDALKQKRFNTFFPLCPDHLITLLQLNAVRALAMNRTLISGILTTPLDCEEEVFHVLPYPANPHLLPPALLPTFLQQTVPHSDWIDIFPCPEARDALIRAVGTFDEDDMWADCVGGLFEGYPDNEIERRGVIAWSPPWDIRGWEASEGFIRKWGWIFQGLPTLFEATNGWRMQRGEEPFRQEDFPEYESMPTTSIP
ncbi:hypothetical protein B0I35DRAFT_414296 [Stachybotrys elegans]|uniref:BZIP domain-containing protein n=1 Tax=Stachybotrys elegans TaxID=80388 RepID=A0A8K0SD17_9HYPO|nr:hypothetical protein B0I35DRAFT_414296 [Stachybotrys elegans]